MSHCCVVTLVLFLWLDAFFCLQTLISTHQRQCWHVDDRQPELIWSCVEFGRGFVLLSVIVAVSLMSRWWTMLLCSTQCLLVTCWTRSLTPGLHHLQMICVLNLFLRKLQTFCLPVNCCSKTGFGKHRQLLAYSYSAFNYLVLPLSFFFILLYSIKVHVIRTSVQMTPTTSF